MVLLHPCGVLRSILLSLGQREAICLRDWEVILLHSLRSKSVILSLRTCVRVCVCICKCVHVCGWLCGQVLTVIQKNHRFNSHQLPLEKRKNIFLHSAPNPGSSKIVNWGPGLGWGRTRPLAVPNSTMEGHSQCSCECLAWLHEFV